MSGVKNLTLVGISQLRNSTLWADLRGLGWPFACSESSVYVRAQASLHGSVQPASLFSTLQAQRAPRQSPAAPANSCLSYLPHGEVLSCHNCILTKLSPSPARTSSVLHTYDPMHELLLYGQVPSGRHDQVLKILAGVAAMQPTRILQRCVVYKPVREPEEPGLNVRRGGTQNIAVKQVKPAAAAAALYYTKLIQKLTDEDFGQDNVTNLSADVKDGDEPKWSMRWEDIPDTGDRGVSIRFTNTTDLLSGDPHTHMVAAGPNR